MVSNVFKGLGAVAALAFALSTASTAEAHIFRHGGSSGSSGSCGSSGSWGSSGGAYYGSWGSCGSSGSWGSSGSSGSWGSSGGSCGWHHHRVHYYSGSSSCGSWGSSGGSCGSSGGCWGTYHDVTPQQNTPPAPPTKDGDVAPMEGGKEARANTGSAILTVSVPADAKVFINGYETKTTGEARQYVSRGLVAGQTYNYEVRAEITLDGKAVTETKTVQLTAGGATELAFNLNGEAGSRIAKTETNKSGR